MGFFVWFMFGLGFGLGFGFFENIDWVGFYLCIVFLRLRKSFIWLVVNNEIIDVVRYDGWF